MKNRVSVKSLIIMSYTEERVESEIEDAKDAFKSMSFEDIVRGLSQDDVERLDEIIRLYGGNENVSNATAPDRMLGWIKLIKEVQEET